MMSPLPEVWSNSGGIMLYGPCVGLERGMFGSVKAFIMSCLDKFLNTILLSIFVLVFVFRLFDALMPSSVMYMQIGLCASIL